jgi:hypothetical protein
MAPMGGSRDLPDPTLSPPERTSLKSRCQRSFGRRMGLRGSCRKPISMLHIIPILFQQGLEAGMVAMPVRVRRTKGAMRSWPLGPVAEAETSTADGPPPAFPLRAEIRLESSWDAASD